MARDKNTVIISLKVSDRQIDQYGVKGVQELAGDILFRYFGEEYFDEDIINGIQQEKEKNGEEENG